MVRFNIIMPVYNAEKDVENAITSVLSQEYDNFSLIVIDDGSFDTSPSIINGFKTNPHIKIFHQENKGIAAAYKKAFSYIDGDYILFLDSDDAMHKDCLRKIADKLNALKVDILQFGIAYYTESWEYIHRLTFIPRVLKGNYAICENYFHGLNNSSDRPNLGIHAYKKELIADFSFPDEGSLGIDEILNLYAMTRCQKIAYIEDVFYLCQSRPNSVSRGKTSTKKNAGVLASYDVMERILLDQHEDLMDMLSIKFLKYYISHVDFILSMTDMDKYRMNAKRYIRLIDDKKRVKITLKHRLAIYLFIRMPNFLKLILG